MSQQRAGTHSDTVAWLALALLLTFAGAPPAAEPPLPRGLIALDGRPAPPLALPDLDGEPYDLELAQGSWAFVHFWASWCGPCRREMPAIARMSERPETRALALVLVNTAESEDTAFTFLAAVAPELTTLLDVDGRTTESWSPRGLPATFLVDPAGRLRYLALGGRPWDAPEYLDFLRSIGAIPDA